jgi:putative transposase
MALRYWTGAHTKHRLLYHLVWVPKYRRRVLRGKVAWWVRHLLYEACKVNQWWIEEVKILPDHVHLLIQVRPTDSVAEVAQQLKGGMSHVLRKEFPDLEEFIWGTHFWAEGYFAETVGARSYAAVKRYIRENADSMPQGKRSRGL